MSDTILAMWATVAIIYLFMYNRNRLLGGIGLTSIGLGMETILSGSSLAGIFGWIIIGTGLMNILYEFNKIRKEFETRGEGK